MESRVGCVEVSSRNALLVPSPRLFAGSSSGQRVFITVINFIYFLVKNNTLKEMRPKMSRTPGSLYKGQYR